MKKTADSGDVALKSEAAAQWRHADTVVREQIEWWADRVERAAVGGPAPVEGL
jgi:hypothetical protein